MPFELEYHRGTAYDANEAKRSTEARLKIVTSKHKVPLFPFPQDVVQGDWANKYYDR